MLLGRPFVVRPLTPVRLSRVTNAYLLTYLLISRDTIYLYLVDYTDFNETCHKYSLREKKLLKSFDGERSKVKVT